MPSSPVPPAGHNRRDRLKEHTSPVQQFSSDLFGAGDDGAMFEEFDVEDHQWSVPGSRGMTMSGQSRGFRGRSMNAWMVLSLSSALLAGGLIILATICLSPHRSWLPSPALIETLANESISSLTPQPISTIDRTMWWLVLVGTLVGNAGLLLSQARSTRWASALCAVTGVLAVAQVIMALVLLRQSVLFFSTRGGAGTLSHLRLVLGKMWVALAGSASGAEALCSIQHQLQCSGLTTCCLTNSTPLELPLAAVSKSFCFISYDNGSMINHVGVDIQSLVRQECGYLTFDVPCTTPTSLHRCLDQMEGAVLAPYGFGFVAHCTWAAMLSTLTYFTAGLARSRPRGTTTVHAALSTDPMISRSGAGDDDEYDPYAY